MRKTVFQQNINVKDTCGIRSAKPTKSEETGVENGRWWLKESESQSARFPKHNLYLDGDYSRWSLENRITFPHLLKDSEGAGAKKEEEGNH